MKIDIKFSCGHSGTVELFGSADERQHRIAYLEKYGMCSDCFKAQQAEADKAISDKYSLPELTGSEKQINWAKRIRVEKIADLEKLFDSWASQRTAANSAQIDAVVSSVIEFVRKQTSAAWWIDNRELNNKKLVKEAMK